MKLLKICLLLLLPALSWSYTTTEFQSDLTNFLNIYNQMVKGMVSSYQVMKKSVPLFPKYEGVMTSLDVSYGSSTYPFYQLQDTVADLRAFSDPKNLFNAGGLSIRDFRLNVGFAFPENFLVFLNLGANRDFSSNNSYNYNLGGQLYYRLVDEEFSVLGVLLGAGYSYSGGSIENKTSSVFADTNTWNGNITGNWGLNAANLEVFIYKTALIFNFYSRLTGSYTFGNIQSAATGSFNTNAINRQTDTSIGQLDVSISGGMEILFGFLGLNVEVGRNWLNGSLYGNIGIRTVF